MEKIKLKVGKTYRSRKGEEVEIVKKDWGRCPYLGNNGESYTESGKWWNSRPEDPEDLIEEVPSGYEPSNICKGNTRPEHPNTELYVGTKIVRGVPMTESDFYKNIKKQDLDRETHGDGYMVTYEDGYVSWSPKEVFERCYRLLSNKEINMAKNVIL